MQWKGAAEADGMGIDRAPNMIAATASAVLLMKNHSPAHIFDTRNLSLSLSCRVYATRCFVRWSRSGNQTGLSPPDAVSNPVCIGSHRANLSRARATEPKEWHRYPMGFSDPPGRSPCCEPHTNPLRVGGQSQTEQRLVNAAELRSVRVAQCLRLPRPLVGQRGSGVREHHVTGAGRPCEGVPAFPVKTAGLRASPALICGCAEKI
jgi:hypothetical protein